MQQFCGVNIIAYYSSAIFVQANFSETSALAASLGFGIINFLFAIPAIYTIDTFGRRNLLLTTFPLMSLFLFFTGFSFLIPDETHHTAHIACIALGIYLFGIVYSPGEGPVPFTYSAEAYPLYIRPLGMSLATATTWFFNFVLSITYPSLQTAFTPTGAFSWYASWNIVGFFAVLLFLPETKGLSLEELDQVFGMSFPVSPTFPHSIRGFLVPLFLFTSAHPPRLFRLANANPTAQASPPTSTPPTASARSPTSSAATSSASPSSPSASTSTSPAAAATMAAMMPIRRRGRRRPRTCLDAPSTGPRGRVLGFTWLHTKTGAPGIWDTT